MSWKWLYKNSSRWRTLFTQLQLPGKSQEGNVIFQIGIQSFSLPNCCLGAMKFLLTIGAQDLIINAMSLLPVTNSVLLWGCEKDSFVNQRGKSAADWITHLPSLRAHFSRVTPYLNADQTWSFVIWLVLLLYPQDSELFTWNRWERSLLAATPKLHWKTEAWQPIFDCWRFRRQISKFLGLAQKCLF